MSLSVFEPGLVLQVGVSPEQLWSLPSGAYPWDARRRLSEGSEPLERRGPLLVYKIAYVLCNQIARSSPRLAVSLCWPPPPLQRSIAHGSFQQAKRRQNLGGALDDEACPVAPAAEGEGQGYEPQPGQPSQEVQRQPSEPEGPVAIRNRPAAPGRSTVAKRRPVWDWRRNIRVRWYGSP